MHRLLFHCLFVSTFSYWSRRAWCFLPSIWDIQSSMVSGNLGSWRVKYICVLSSHSSCNKCVVVYIVLRESATTATYNCGAAWDGWSSCFIVILCVYTSGLIMEMNMIGNLRIFSTLFGYMQDFLDSINFSISFTHCCHRRDDYHVDLLRIRKWNKRVLALMKMPDRAKLV